MDVQAGPRRTRKPQPESEALLQTTGAAPQMPRNERLEAIQPDTGGAKLHGDKSSGVPAGLKRQREERTVTFANQPESEAVHHEAPDNPVAGTEQP